MNKVLFLLLVVCYVASGLKRQNMFNGRHMLSAEDAAGTTSEEVVASGQQGGAESQTAAVVQEETPSQGTGSGQAVAEGLSEDTEKPAEEAQTPERRQDPEMSEGDEDFRTPAGQIRGEPVDLAGNTDDGEPMRGRVDTPNTETGSLAPAEEEEPADTSGKVETPDIRQQPAGEQQASTPKEQAQPQSEPKPRVQWNRPPPAVGTNVENASGQPQPKKEEGGENGQAGDDTSPPPPQEPKTVATDEAEDKTSSKEEEGGQPQGPNIDNVEPRPSTTQPADDQSSAKGFAFATIVASTVSFAIIFA